MTYSREIKNVVLVPVNSSSFPSAGTDLSVVAKRLNEIYSPAVVNWHVSYDHAIEVGKVNEEDFKVEGTSMLSKYTPDMNKVIRKYKRERPTDDNTMYLFFLNIPDLGSNRKGFMPLAGNYGFIFNFGTDLELLAHELAHGAFNLRHTFSDKAQYYFPQNQTANLLDYAGGTELWKYQWDLIHNPEKVLFAWGQDEEEGAYKYWIADDYIQNKKVEIAYWKWQNDGAPKLTIDEVENEYFSNSMNDYQKRLFHGIATDIANLKSRDKESAEMFKVLVEEGTIDGEILTVLIKERHELAEYHRTVVPLLATGDILMKYCVVLSVFSSPSSLPSMGKVGTYIADLSGAKAANLASKVSVTFAELQPGQWLMRTGKLFMQGAIIDASIQTVVNMVIAEDFETAIGEIDFADVAITGAINVVVGGGASLSLLYS